MGALDNIEHQPTREIVVASPQVVKADIDLFIDSVRGSFTVNALRMLTTVSGVASDARLTDTVGAVGAALSGPLSRLESQEKTLDDTLSAYVAVVASATTAEERAQQGADAAAAVAGRLEAYAKGVEQAFKSWAEAAKTFTQWARGKAYQHYKTKEGFDDAHQDVRQAMLYFDLVIAGATALCGATVAVAPFMAPVPLVLEIGKKIGDEAVINALAWMDSRSEAKVRAALPYIVKGETPSMADSAWALLKSKENPVAAAGVAKEVLEATHAPAMTAEAVAPFAESAVGAASLLLVALKVGMTLTELVELETRQDKEVGLTGDQRAEVEILRRCCDLAFPGVPKRSINIRATNGELVLLDTSSGRQLFAPHDGNVEAVPSAATGSADLALEWAKTRYTADGIPAPGGGGRFFADWANAEFSSGDRRDGYRFNIDVVDEEEECFAAGIKVDDKGGVLDFGIGARRGWPPGLTEALNGAKPTCFAVAFASHGTGSARGGAMKAYEGFVVNWDTAKYVRGAAFRGRFVIDVGCKGAAGQASLTISPNGELLSDGKITVGELTGGKAIDGSVYDDLAEPASEASLKKEQKRAADGERDEALKRQANKAAGHLSMAERRTLEANEKKDILKRLRAKIKSW